MTKLDKDALEAAKLVREEMAIISLTNPAENRSIVLDRPAFRYWGNVCAPRPLTGCLESDETSAYGNLRRFQSQ